MAVMTDALLTILSVEDRGFSAGFKRAAGSIDLLTGRIDGLNNRLGDFTGGGLISTRMLSFFGRAALSAGQEAAAFTRAAGNFKGAFPVSDLERFTGSLQDLTGVDDGEIADLLGVLGTFKGIGRGEAESLALPILNAAESLKALGVDRASLANQIGKAVQTGDAGGLRRVGIIVDETGFKMQNLQQRAATMARVLQAQGGDAAIAFRNTLPGAIQAATNSVGNLTDALGSPLITPLNSAANLVDSLARGFTSWPAPVQGAATAVGVTLALGLGAASAATKITTLMSTRYLGELVKLTREQRAAAGEADHLASSIGRVGISAGAVRLSGGGAGGMSGGAGIGTAALAAEASQAGKLGGLLKGKGGAALSLLAALGIDYGLSMLPDQGPAGDFKAIGTGASTGFGIGATVGSIIPGVGTAAGGATGAVIGGGVGYFSHEAEKAEAKKAAAGGNTRLEQLMEENNRLLKQIGDGAKVSTSVLPSRDRAIALQMARDLP